MMPLWVVDDLRPHRRSSETLGFRGWRFAGHVWVAGTGPMCLALHVRACRNCSIDLASHGLFPFPLNVEIASINPIVIHTDFPNVR